MKAECPALVRDPHRPIHVLFHQHLGGPNRLMNLIEAPLMRDGKILAQTAGRLEAQDAVQLSVCRTEAMQIGGLRGLNGEASVVDRQIALQKPIRSLQRGDLREPQLLDSRSWTVLKSRSTRPFACGEWTGISSTPSSPSARPN